MKKMTVELYKDTEGIEQWVFHCTTCNRKHWVDTLQEALYWMHDDLQRFHLEDKDSNEKAQYEEVSGT